MSEYCSNTMKLTIGLNHIRCYDGSSNYDAIANKIS